MPNSFDYHVERRAVHERARQQSRSRIASVPGAHGALYTSLRTGLLGMGDQLDEAHLVPMFTFSRNAVRDALRLLADEGLVSRQPRNGTVVIAKSADVPLNIALGWAEQVHPRREVVVTDRRWAPSTPMTRLYLRSRSDRVHVTEAIDMYDGRPSMLHTRFTIDGAERALIASPASDHEFRVLFENTYGSSLCAIDCWVEATGADERAAARLGVAAGTPLIVKSRVLHSSDGLPREYSISHYLASEVTFSASVAGTELLGAQQPRPDVLAGRTEKPVDQDGNSLERGRSSSDLHAQLRAAIREGVYRLGDRLSEEEVAEAFAISRNSVRLAMAQLADEGIITRSRRQGTVVTSTIADYTLNVGMIYRPEELGRYGGEELTSLVIPTPPFISEMLQTASTSTRLDEYLISRDGKPTTVYIRYTGTDVERRPLTFSSGGDFQALFSRTYGTPAGRIAHSLHAVCADRQIARRLSVPPGTIVLLSERLIHDQLGVPREFSHSYHVAAGVSLASRHEFHTEPTGRSGIVHRRDPGPTGSARTCPPSVAS
jgi:DNA-binding GntR family transcriptional regulator